MKALPFILLVLIASVQCFHVLPSFSRHHRQSNFVCPTFPFCFQQLETGVWKSLPGKNELNSTAVSTLLRDAHVESSECWINGYFCRFDSSNMITSIELDTAEECNIKCVEDDACKVFSFHETRGQGSCSLLKECLVNRKCTEAEHCANGPKTCSCPKLEYLPGNKDSTQYARWTCGDHDPYTTEIPVGTTCSTTCAAWKESTIKSTCLKNGKWSATALLSYSASYPTPEQPDMECGCQEVGPFNYDPNTEVGAEFVCKGRDKDDYKKVGGWTIKTSDNCQLFCSNALKPVVSVYCDGAAWQGEPELGFWCYDKPENPGPAPIKAPAPTKCSNNANLISVAPVVDNFESSRMVLCDDPANSICEQDIQTTCPAGYHLCSYQEFISLNDNWYFKVDPKNRPVGEKYCRGRGPTAGAGHFTLGIENRNRIISLSNDEPKNNMFGSSRPECTAGYGCDEKHVTALCCSASPQCGNGVVNHPLEECDDGNDSNEDDCLNSCTFRIYGEH